MTNIVITMVCMLVMMFTFTGLSLIALFSLVRLVLEKIDDYIHDADVIAKANKRKGY